MSKKLPTFKFERSWWRKGYLVIGIDEVGRGALSGPITVGAVCFPAVKKLMLQDIGINDSKQISAKKRQSLAKIIKRNSLANSAVCVSPLYINNHGIVKAEEKAIRRTIKSIRKKLTRYKFFVLIDAYTVRYLRGIGIKNQKGIVHGDELSISIAAASIIAKCHRDSVMEKLGLQLPRYHWKDNKGYGTKEHIRALKKYGRTKYHRDVFINRII